MGSLVGWQRIYRLYVSEFKTGTPPSNSPPRRLHQAGGLHLSGEARSLTEAHQEEEEMALAMKQTDTIIMNHFNVPLTLLVIVSL